MREFGRYREAKGIANGKFQVSDGKKERVRESAAAAGSYRRFEIFFRNASAVGLERIQGKDAGGQPN